MARAEAETCLFQAERVAPEPQGVWDENRSIQSMCELGVEVDF